MNKLSQFKLINLVAFYLGLFCLYVLLPDALDILKRVISPVLLATLAVISVVSLGSLKRR
ncbi:MAG TPA: hypothetical protein VK963_01220 [Candidatus Saccharimonadales bacterium]|nr:hypothetical protein [Candidatus Saccharimonadales bacterium]